MQTLLFDILRMDGDGAPVWVEAAASMEVAKTRIGKLGRSFPGEYLIFHSKTAKVVASIQCEEGGIPASAAS